MLSGIERDKLKVRAVRLRRQGVSFPTIEKKLEVHRSTLSGWFSALKLSDSAQKIILNRKKDNLKVARVLAAKSKNLAREVKKKKVKAEVAHDFFSLPKDKTVKEALLAMLYLGEGFKRTSTIGLGNSNPRILYVFVKLLREIYQVPNSRLSCYLHLRADQNSEKEKKFWSKSLKIPLSCFRKSQIDKRTTGKKTWKNYHGVCAVYCHDAELEKHLTAWQEVLLEKL